MGSLMNIIGAQGLRRVFIFLDDIELYGYHKKIYDGFVADSLQTINELKQNCWKIFPIPLLSEWLNEPF